MGGRHTPTPEEYEKLRKKRERKHGWYNRLKARKPAGAKAVEFEVPLSYEDKTDAPWRHDRCSFCGAPRGVRTVKNYCDDPNLMPDTAPAVWSCPCGCGTVSTLCIYCFPDRVATPFKLTEWSGWHLAQCGAPEAIITRQQDDALAWPFYENKLYAQVYAARLALAVSTLHIEPMELAVVRRIARAEIVDRVQVDAALREMRHKPHETPYSLLRFAYGSVLARVGGAESALPRDASPCGLAVKWARAAHLVAKDELGAMRLAEVAVRTYAFIHEAPAPENVIDAATAAWCVGHEDVAARLLSDYRAPRAPKTPRCEREEDET